VDERIHQPEAELLQAVHRGDGADVASQGEQLHTFTGAECHDFAEPRGIDIIGPRADDAKTGRLLWAEPQA
jgi:hypothetical protein